MSEQPSSGSDLERRHIRLPGTSNLRDLGGYPGAGGRGVRWGSLYRSGAMPKLDEADWQWMHEREIAVVCDLRSAAERELAPTRWQGPKGTRHIHADYDAALIYGRRFVPPRPGAAVNDLHQSLYALFVDLLAPAFKEIFAALLDDQTPIIFHCSAGQDRTGLAAGLLLSLLGVDRHIIYADYLLSTKCRRFENELDRTDVAEFAETNLVARFFTDAIRENGINAVRPPRLVDDNGNALLQLAFDEIEGRFGSIEEYARQRLEIGPDDIERLQDMYLDPQG